MANIYYFGREQAYDYEELTVAASAVGCTASKIKVVVTGVPEQRHRLACKAVMICTTNPIRFRLDGTDPTSSVGHALSVGEQLVIEGYDNIKAFRAISQGATGALQVTYFRVS